MSHGSDGTSFFTVTGILADLAMNRIVIRDGKGQKDRVTVLPEAVRPLLEEHLRR